MGPLLSGAGAITVPPSTRTRVLANAVLAIGIVLGAVVLAYVLFRGDRLLVGVGRSLFFAGLPTALIVVCAAAFRLPPSVRETLAIGLVAAGAAAYAAELYFRVRPPATDATLAAAREAGGNFDTRGKWEVVRDLRAEGVDAYPAVFAPYLLRTGFDGALHSPLTLDGDEVLPLLGGVPGARTVLCNESGAYVTYDSDAFGFNNPPGLWENVDEAAPVTLVAVGDSFVQGYCVERADSFAGRLRAAHPRTFGLGISGSGSLVQLAVLREFGPVLRPRTVLWFFFEGNDMGNIEVERRSPQLMAYLDPAYGQRIAERSAVLGRALRDHVDGLYAAESVARETSAGPLQAAISFVGLAQVRARLRLPSTTSAADYGLLADILETARDMARSWDGRLVVVYLPDYGSVATAGDGGGPADAVYAAVPDLLDRLNIPMIDARAAFAAHPDPASLFPFRLPNHYNEAGHRLVADAVLDGLDGLEPGR